MDHLEKENTLLNRLDQPLRFLGIHKDEASVLMVPILGGMFLGWVLCGFCCGIGLLTSLRALKSRHEGASLIHAMYWYLPTPQNMLKLSVPSYVREYIA